MPKKKKKKSIDIVDIMLLSQKFETCLVLSNVSSLHLTRNCTEIFILSWNPHIISYELVISYRIYEQYMNENAFSFLGEQDLQFPHLQKWLGISVAGTVELGHIVDSPVIRAATSLVPLGWTGIPREKNGDPLKVDISGFGLHQCTLIQARVNGRWYFS